MTAANATAFTPDMTLVTGNAGGAIGQLAKTTQFDGSVRKTTAQITLAGQASGTTFGIARIPLPAAITEIAVASTVSLGSATLAFGDAANTTQYAAAANYTSTGIKSFPFSAACGIEIDSGYDCVSGAARTDYEDVTMTTGAAALPGSGTLTIMIEYVTPR